MLETVSSVDRQDFWERAFLVILRQRMEVDSASDMADLADECAELWAERFEEDDELPPGVDQ